MAAAPVGRCERDRHRPADDAPGRGQGVQAKRQAVDADRVERVRYRAAIERGQTGQFLVCGTGGRVIHLRCSVGWSPGGSVGDGHGVALHQHPAGQIVGEKMAGRA